MYRPVTFAIITVVLNAKNRTQESIAYIVNILLK